MKTETRASWTDNYLRWPNAEAQEQNVCQPVIQLQPVTGIYDAQMLMLLPFEIMRQYLESMMLQQFEITTGMYSKQATELDNAFMKHIDKFDRTVSIGFKNVSGR